PAPGTDFSDIDDFKCAKPCEENQSAKDEKPLENLCAARTQADRQHDLADQINRSKCSDAEWADVAESAADDACGGKEGVTRTRDINDAGGDQEKKCGESEPDKFEQEEPGFVNMNSFFGRHQTVPRVKWRERGTVGNTFCLRNNSLLRPILDGCNGVRAFGL